MIQSPRCSDVEQPKPETTRNWITQNLTSPGPNLNLNKFKTVTTRRQSIQNLTLPETPECENYLKSRQPITEDDLNLTYQNQRQP